MELSKYQEAPTAMPLYEYQEAIMPSLERLVAANKPIVLMALSTGTGKTPISLHLMKRTGKRFGVIAPRVTLSAWRETAARLGLKPEFVVNIEKIRTGRQKQIVEKKSNYVWNWTGLRPGDWLLADEFHRYTTGPESQSIYMMANAGRQGIHICGMTATLGSSPISLRLPAYLAGLASPWNNFYPWLRQHGCSRNADIQGHPWQFLRGPAGQQIMSDLNKKFFPEFGVRLDSKDIPNFPSLVLSVDLLTPSDDARAAVNAAYAGMRDELRNPDKSSNDLVRTLRWRMRVEMEKVNGVIREMVEDILDSGNESVFVALNFTDSLFRLKELLSAHSPAMIYGEDPSNRQQKEGERTEAIRRFQKNETRVMLANQASGGVGVNLGDETGEAPRVALVNPDLSVVNFVQTLGRVRRATSKSPSVARVVLLDGVPIEQKLHRLLTAKLENLSALQADDFADLIRNA